MTDTTTTTGPFDRARRDLLIASAVAALLMIGVALFAPVQHLWGVIVGCLLAIANLSALAQLTARLLGDDELPAAAAIKTVLKVLALMAVVVGVLLTRPQYALGLCLGLALPAVAGLVLILRGRDQRQILFGRLRAKATRN